MSAKKNPVSTPLHLLQHLSHSLLEHLENACSEALVDAEKMLAKLEKQRGKGQDLLHKGFLGGRFASEVRIKKSTPQLIGKRRRLHHFTRGAPEAGPNR